MSQKKYMRVLINIEHEVVLEVDESLTPDDEWRGNFYNIYTLEEMAGHIAHNVILFGAKSFVEGVGDPGDDTFRVIDQAEDEDEPDVEELPREMLEEWGYL